MEQQRIIIAQVNEGVVFQNDTVMIAWSPEGGCWTEDGQ